MAKTIREVMTANPQTIDSNATIAEAARVMKTEDTGIVPVTEGSRVVGVLTDRDIVVRVVAEGRDPSSVPVTEITSSQLVTIDPQQDLDEALRIMATHQVRRLPVVEEDGRLIGIVSQADVAREAEPAKTGEVVEEISQ